MFSLCPHLGGGGGGQVQLRGGGVSGSKVNPAGGGGGGGGGVQVKGQSSWGGGGGSGPAGGGGLSGQRSIQPSCGRYASCVHAGGLSCLNHLYNILISIIQFTGVLQYHKYV